MKKISVKFIAESTMIAALYVVTTWLLAPISYGPIQFRISEALILQIVLGIIFMDALTSFYYYLYFLFPIFSILLSIFTYRNTKTNNEPKEEAS